MILRRRITSRSQAQRVFPNRYQLGPYIWIVHLWASITIRIVSQWHRGISKFTHINSLIYIHMTTVIGIDVIVLSLGHERETVIHLHMNHEFVSAFYPAFIFITWSMIYSCNFSIIFVHCIHIIVLLNIPNEWKINYTAVHILILIHEFKIPSEFILKISDSDSQKISADA